MFASGAPTFKRSMTVCVIPAFRAADSIVDVVCGVLSCVDRVIVVDDCCPQECGLVVQNRFSGDSRVEVLRHHTNRGVGSAMKSGIRRSLQLGADVIVKVDADGQMDPFRISDLVAALKEQPQLAFVKGNRFFESSVARVMPGIRLFGNSVLTLLVRLATGYWSSIDPTNGYFALRGSVARRLNLNRLAERYYFEISLLAELGLRRAEMAEIDISARYGTERSSLSIRKAMLTFPPRLLWSLLRRLGWQYFIADMNVGSLFLVFGSMLFGAGVVLGAASWAISIETGVARTAGTVTLVLVPLIMGFQLLLNAVLYDVQSSPRVLKVLGPDVMQGSGDEERVAVLQPFARRSERTEYANAPRRRL